MPQTTLEQIREKIIASKIPPSVIAKEIGMLRGSFNNKLKGNNNARFSIGEIDKIEVFLKETCEKVNKL